MKGIEQLRKEKAKLLKLVNKQKEEAMKAKKAMREKKKLEREINELQSDLKKDLKSRARTLVRKARRVAKDPKTRRSVKKAKERLTKFGKGVGNTLGKLADSGTGKKRKWIWQ